VELSHFSHRPPLVTFSYTLVKLFCQPFLSANFRLTDLCKNSMTSMQKDMLISAHLGVRINYYYINKSE
jgi:hypothetical protein